MVACTLARTAFGVLLFMQTCPSAVGTFEFSEVISDLGSVVGPSAAEESEALEIKAQEFWQPVLDAAQEMNFIEHLETYAQVEKVLAELPTENEFVRQGLSDALKRLRRADQAVLAQAQPSLALAAEQLKAPSDQSGLSFFFGGNFLQQALQRFVAGGRYPEKLMDQVMQRQADILPVLQGAASSAGNVLDDTRLASKAAFDVLKYDIYHRGVPTTPQAAKDVANKLVDAVGETRHRFMQFITQTVQGISRDFEGRREGASRTVTQSALRRADVDDAGFERIVTV